MKFWHVHWYDTITPLFKHIVPFSLNTLNDELKAILENPIECYMHTPKLH